MAIHSIVPLHVTQTAEREVWSEVLEGTFDECMDAAPSYNVGTTVDDPALIDSIYQPPIIYTALNLTRKEGMLAELSYSYSVLLKREAWSLDMAEISKDIRTWLTTPAGGMTQSEAAVALAHIAAWEAFKDNGDLDRWMSFIYDDDGRGNISYLTGNALVLAQKIMKGIQSYSIYAPVITRTTMWSTTPPSGHAGMIETPAPRAGWSVIGGVPNWTGLATEWLKTAERSTSNGDGTYTFIEQWTGADQIDGDLYSDAPVTPAPTGGTGGTS